MPSDQHRIRCASAELITGAVKKVHVDKAVHFLTNSEFELFTLKAVLGQTIPEIANRFGNSIATVNRRWNDVLYLLSIYTEFCTQTDAQKMLIKVHKLYGNDGNILLGIFRGFSKSQIQTATGVSTRKMSSIVKWHIDLNRGGGGLVVFFDALEKITKSKRIYDVGRKPLRGKALCRF